MRIEDVFVAQNSCGNIVGASHETHDLKVKGNHLISITGS